MPRPSPASPALLAALLLLAPSLARADLPPPEGNHYVGYRFRVDGIAKLSPDHVIVVYPWSMSSGMPTRELTSASEGQWISLGRRSAPPSLYAVRKADYEALSNHGLPTEVKDDDPKLQALLSKGAKCNLAPNAVFTLPNDDPRDTVDEIFVAQTISDTSCVLTKSDPAANPAANAPTNSAANAPASSSDPSASVNGPPRKDGGCAGCAVGDNRVASGMSLVGLLIGLASFVKRRTRR